MSPPPARLPIPPQYYPYPASMLGLDPTQMAGLHALSAVATISTLSTFGLLSFLLYRAIFWERYYTTTLTRNQNIVLLANLLLADLIQAIGFLFSTYWAHLDGILSPTPACTAQGFLLNLGDVTSGSFVFLISIHTSISVLRGPSIPLRYVMVATAFCWAFGIFISSLGLAIYGQSYYTAAGIWCWVGGKHENARLWSHYTWIFVFEFGTLMVYVLTFVLLRKRIGTCQSNLRMMNPASNQYRDVNTTNNRINRVTYYMIMYPVVYFVCTAPLAIGRMYSMNTGKPNPEWFYILAGCLILSCGWLDSIVYALTRRVFVREHNGDRSNLNNYNNSSYAKGSRSGMAGGTLERHGTDDLELLEITSKHDGQKPLSLAPPPPTKTTIDSTMTRSPTKTNNCARSLSRKARGGGATSSAESDNESLIRPFSENSEHTRTIINVRKDFEVLVQSSHVS